MKQLLEQTLEDRLAYLLNGSTIKQPQLMSDVDAVERKKELFARRQVEIVKAKAKAKLLDSAIQDDGAQQVQYPLNIIPLTILRSIVQNVKKRITNTRCISR